MGAVTSLLRGERVPYLGMASQHTRIRLGRTFAIAGVAAFIASVALRIAVALAHPESQWTMIDLSVYSGAGEALSHHQSQLYSSRFGMFPLPYIYPPFSALVFHELDWLTFDQLQLLAATVSITCLAAVVWAAWGMLGYRVNGARLGAAGATAAVCLWLEPVISTLNFGQINLLVMGLVVVDLAQSDRKWTKGIGVGLATAIKLTPGLFVVYLLITRRFRAAMVATGTFAVTVFGTWAALPKASREFWFHAIGVTPVGRDYLSNQSFEGLFLRLTDNSDTAAKLPWLFCCAAIIAAGMVAAALASNRGAELLGICLTSVVALAISPISWTSHWVWFALLIVLATDTAIRSRRTWMRLWTAIGVVLLLAWPMHIDGTGVSDTRLPLIPTGMIWYVPHTGGREEGWDPAQIIFGNAYLICGVAFVAVMAVREFRRLARGGRAGDAEESVRSRGEIKISVG